MIGTPNEKFLVVLERIAIALEKIAEGPRKLTPSKPRTKQWDIMTEAPPEDLKALWIEAYKDADWIRSELVKARAWLKSNPERAKKNYKRFANNWLSTAYKMKNGVKVEVDYSELLKGIPE